MKISKAFPYIIPVLLIGCSTPKFYKEVKSTYAELPSNGTSIKSNNKEKIILDILRDELQNTDHIILFLMPGSSSFGDNDFWSVLFDVENEIYHLVENTKDRTSVKHNLSVLTNNYYAFVIMNYMDGKLDYLKELGEISNHSGIQTTNAIYEIDLKNNLRKRSTFKSFLFMDGKPTRDVH